MATVARDSRTVRSLLGDPLMVERSVEIVNKLGIHARPAAEIVITAAKFKSNITIVRDEMEFIGMSFIGWMIIAA